MNSFKASIAATVLVASAVNLHAQSVLTPSSTGNKVHLNFNNQAASDAIDSLSHQMSVVRDSLTQLAITQAYQQVSLSSASLQITGASLMDSLRVMNFTDLDGDLDVGGDVHITGTVTGITAAMVGLGNADNTADADKPVSTATQTALDLKAPLASPAFSGTVTGITAAMVGLGNADNTADADKPVSTATQTALDLKAPLASPAFTGTVTGITAAMVGLGNADNTADADKPVSTATQTALDLKAPLASPAFTGTVTGITAAMVGLGNADNTTDADKPVSTAAQTALDLKAPLASPAFTGTVTGITAAMVGLGNADNTADADKPVSTATQTALDLKAPLASPAFSGTVTGITAAMVGLGNADNTADADKPVSTATQTALDLKAPLESPAFTGSPSLPTGATAITQPAFDNSTKLATTAYTDAAVEGVGGATLQMLNAFASGFEHLIDSLSCTWTKHQGHVYELVLIGNQCWFAENLQATHYANGVEIQEITDGAAWSVATEGARVAYENDPTNVATYGYLYNWFAVDSAAGLCPSGWHVPSTDEWNTLTDYIGGLSTAGVKLKSAAPSWDGIDSVGFSGLPGGYRNPYNFGSFAGKSERGDWWSATESGEMTAWHRQMALNNPYVGRFSFFTKQFAFSVRCLRD